MRCGALLLILTLGLGCGDTFASDFNPLGFYIGGAVGRADVRASSVASLYPPYEFNQSDTGWKVLVGLRPIPMVAAELAYVDFGHPGSQANLAPSTTLHYDLLQRAQTLSALVFMPIPLPLLDVYVRAGLARLESSGNGSLQCNLGYTCALIIQDLRFNHTNVDFHYGAGLQAKLRMFAVRLEYERIKDGRGNPDLLSAGLLWTF